MEYFHVISHEQLLMMFWLYSWLICCEVTVSSPKEGKGQFPKRWVVFCAKTEVLINTIHTTSGFAISTILFTFSAVSTGF
jgi:hypothetical protein